jgi:hypothetical protein
MRKTNKWLPLMLGAMFLWPAAGAERIVLCEEFTATT